MNIAICYSPDWAPHVAIEVFAIQQTNPGAKVYLLSDAAGRLDLPGCVFVDVEALFQQRIPTDRSISSRFTKYAHYRLLLPEVIPEPRVLYVDADAIVNADLQDLWETGLEGGALVAGVRDTGILPAQVAAIGLSPGDPYINAGVTLMDLDGIRAAGLYESWLHEINTFPYSCGDQDVINKTCRGRIRLVGNEYNSSLSTGFSDAPRIMHWAGPAGDKPWCNPAVTRYDIWKRWKHSHDGLPVSDCQPGERIPRTIHYCWFGGAPKPPLVQRCIDSWRRLMPDYAIKEWNESNFNPNCTQYTRDAYAARKWAFVSDYMRMRALYWEGGLYMDADVEALRPLDEGLRHRAFTGHETQDLMVTATMGAEPGHPWIKMLLDYYNTAMFEGRTPNTQVITRLSQPWVERHEAGFRYLREGVVIYPIEYFCPFDHVNLRPTPSRDSFCIHHFQGSWTPRGAIAV